jgi:acyl-CoA synthetase (AMP-forming)/AMP-acid ligase II
MAIGYLNYGKQKRNRKVKLTISRWNGIKTKPTKNIPSFEDDSWCALEADDLALIQYTSGSTGKPKGICITHNNIRHQVTWMITGFHLVKPSPDIVSMAWTPQYHDMGLFMGYFVPIYSGGMGYVMSPLEFISNPVLWPRCLEKYKATFTCGPNFSFGLTIRRLKELDEVCDNSQLHFVAMGAEPSDITLLPDIEKWMGIPQDSVSNGYGLAEHTLIVCGHSSRSTYNGSWSIGWIDPADPRCLPVVVKIVDPNTGQECSDGEEGEIWASSVCVARGYYNKPELSKEVFEAQLPNDDRFYLRTGDLGVVSNGQLFFISRLKDLIIINGRNYAPSDIEQCCEKEFSKAIRPGCSVAFQKDEESVVLVCEIRPGLEEQMSLDLLAAQIRTFVEKEEGISISEVILLEKHGVPKTTSGKVQRHKVLELWKQDKLKVLSHAEKGGLSGAKNLKQLFKSKCNFHLPSSSDYPLTRTKRRDGDGEAGKGWGTRRRGG